MSAQEARPGALAGLRVLDLGHGVAGPFAARLLGDLGADVVKVESPEGDFLRTAAPVVTDDEGRPASLLFSYANWNKRGVVVDLRDPAERDRVERLVRWADVVISSFRPGRLEEWGYGFDQLAAWNPRLALTSITNFGLTGPRAQDPASDLTFYALSGLSSISGFADPHPPLKHGLRQSLYCAGLNGAYSALLAHRTARRSGTAQHVDVSIHEALSSELVTAWAYYSFAGVVQGRHPQVADPLEGLPLQAQDGFVSFQTNERAPLAALAELLGNDDLHDPRWVGDEYRVEHAAEFRETVESSLADRPASAWFDEASRRGLLVGLVQSGEQLLDCPQLAARGALQPVPRHGDVRFPVSLAHFSRTPTRVERPAPYLGEHDAVAAELAELTERAAAEPPDPAVLTEGPLHGLVVVELAGLVSVPYVGALLADLGATVIKVEAPSRPDPLRYSFGPFIDNEPGEAPWNRAGGFHVLNRGKRSLVCDMRSEEGRVVLERLVAGADVVIENFSSGVLTSWGMSPERALEVNPRLVMLSNTGFGASGPWATYKAQGTTLEVTMGSAVYTGYPGGDPGKAGQSYPDFLACWSGVLSILAALEEREVSGRGQWIDQGMYQLGAAVIPEGLLGAQVDGLDLSRRGPEDLDALASGMFATRLPGEWLAVSVPDATAAARLDPLLRAAGHAAPVRRPEHLVRALRLWLSHQEAAVAERTLLDLGIPTGRVLSSQGLHLDPHLAERSFFEPVTIPGCDEEFLLMGRPFRFVTAPGAARSRGPAPEFGRDNREVLVRYAGFTPDEAEALCAGTALVDRPLRFPEARPVDFEALIRAGRFDAQVARPGLDPDMEATA